MGSDATIRPGVKTDLPQITELWHQLVHFNVNRDGRLPKVAGGGDQQWQDRIDKLLADSTFRLYVAESGGRLVGFATGFLRYPPEAFEGQKVGNVADILVIRGWRRRGVARRLLSAITRWFHQERVSHIEMGVVLANPAAVGFWRAVGAQDYRATMWLPADWESRLRG